MSLESPYQDYSVGDKIKIYFNPGNINNKTYEIRGLVDNQLIVRHKGIYDIWSPYYFERIRRYIKKDKG